jgi:peptide/nickel transport system substrate-binding protein
VPKIGIPDQVVSMSTPDSHTLVINLNKPVNPVWFFENSLAGIIPLPSHAWAKASANGPILDFTNPANATKIYQFLAAQAKSVKTYASDPVWQVVDGPYKLTSFNSTTGAFTMAPNSSYGGPRASKPSTLQAVPFTSDTAEFNAVKSGSIDQGYLPFTDLPQVKSIEGTYNVFGYPAFGFNYVTYNFKDTTGDFNNIIKQLYFRQAFAHLEDEQGYVKAFFHGAGGLDFGPVPQIPASPYTPANAKKDPYPFSVSTAASILKAHGWTVTPGGTDVCNKPGTASNECGSGIPAGTKLAFNLIYNTTPLITGEVEDLASNAKQAGIQITLSGSNFNYMISNYNDVASPANANKWATQDFGGEGLSPYPTAFGLFNTNGSAQIGNYSNPTADSLINASITSPNPQAVTNELAFFATNLPVMWQPLRDHVYAWKTNVSATTPNAFENLTQYTVTPEFWYLTK